MTGSALDRPDRARFEAIYLEHHAFVGRCLARWGVPEAGIDDARQDVFLTAFRRLHTYAGHASIRSWLAGISRRVAWRHRRTRQRHDRRVDALARVSRGADSLDEWVRTREAQAVLDAFLEALDPPKREAFVLCELEGLSAREAAGATGVNQATLYSRLRVARSSFASMCASLEDDGIAVEPQHAAAIHRQAHHENRQAAMRGWMLLAPKVAGSAALLTKPVLLIALGLGGAGAVGAVAFGQPASTSEPAPVVAAAPGPAEGPSVPRQAAAVPPAEPAQAEAEAEAEAKPEPEVTPTPAHSPRPAEPAPDDLAAQVEQLDVAERHLDDQDWADAAQVAEAHLKRWPKGQLARDALRVAVRAHCEDGKREAAVAVAHKHLDRDEAWDFVDRRCGKKPSPEIMKPRGAGD